MPAAWPSSVPSRPIRGSISIPELHRPPLRTDMQSGSTRARKVASVAVARLSWQIAMTAAQFAAFRVWERDTLIDGTAEFSVTPPGASGPKTCKFAQTPTATDVGGHVAVSVSVDVRDW